MYPVSTGKFLTDFLKGLILRFGNHKSDIHSDKSTDYQEEDEHELIHESLEHNLHFRA